MLQLVCETFAALGALLLLLAACSKLGAPRTALAAPLTAFGVPPARAATATLALGVAELGTVVFVIFERGPAMSFAVASFGTLFLGAGLVSLAKGWNVPCHCLGGHHIYHSRHGRLGWPQVVGFPLWILLAGLPRIGSFQQADYGQRWVVFSIVTALVAGTFIARLIGPLRSARSLRLAVSGPTP